MWVQVLQAGFVEKTAQLQALQQQVSGRRTPDPELTALQLEMQESQARHSVCWPSDGPRTVINTYTYKWHDL